MNQPLDPTAQAAALLQAGKAKEAIAVIQRALQRRASDGPLLMMLARAHIAAGQFDQAEFAIDRIGSARPRVVDDAHALMLRGQLESARRRYDRAIAAYQDLLRQSPGIRAAYEALASTQLSADDLPGALATLEAGVCACPRESNLWHVYAMTLVLEGQAARALEVARRGVRAMPEHPDLRGTLCHVLNYVPDASMTEIASAHKDFGVVAMSYIKTQPPPFSGSRDPERPLRVGFVSGDFKTHSCAYFFEPLLDNLDRAVFEPVLYHRDAVVDQTTQRLASKAKLEHVAAMPYKDLAAKMRADALDIVIDLSGHTAGGSLYALIRRPAPVQATWLGYPNTTGLATMDYRIVDRFTDPARDAVGAARTGLPAEWPGADAFAHEALARLPRCFLCYKPPGDAPEVSPLPGADPSRPITFASFNAVQKMNPRVIKLWAGAMRAAPGSRLLLKANYRLSFTVNMLRELLAAEGIGADRVEFRPMTKTTREHFETYHQADIALDTFPYHGTTTTCEALHMGLPVITRVGTTHAGRVGLSLLEALGMPELACATDEAFAAAAGELARDRQRLAMMRSTMRARLAASPLSDGADFADAFQVALRQMWRHWCQAGEEQSRRETTS